ncbi:hypothetical protein C8250_042510 [Streptomyces sp. So13.3]|uniref:hypothetical protein n=1 Tax=Streptomyces TaxID=1883 RepID=UPI00164DAF2E|nr:MULTISPECIES: hypothetical protein [Streptomyces]MCZ4103516.1 hypothetical protein [Streptomyces sp. H39-C1]QNA70568.1 hypothetical protein C8250_042510 [Streptomyces sp. So13.3]
MIILQKVEDWDNGDFISTGWCRTPDTPHGAHPSAKWPNACYIAEAAGHGRRRAERVGE